MKWVRTYQSLFYPNDYGERASTDVLSLVRLLRSWVQQKGADLAVSDEVLARQILKYIAMRRHWTRDQIQGPHMPLIVPPIEWNRDTEQIWEEWIWHTFDWGAWQRRILGVIFQSGVRLWEADCDGWRNEIYDFLPAWIRRDMECFRRIDPRPLPDVDPAVDEKDPRSAKIDPYLLDHGGRKGRRLRGGHTAGIIPEEA